MDSLKETDNLATKPSKRPRIEVDEELMRQMINTQTSDVKELAGFRRKKFPLPDFERTFFAPADCRNRSAIYISAATKYKVSAILHLLGMRIQGLQLWSTICCAL